MPYLVHPDKLAAIEQVIQTGKANAIGKKAKPLPTQMAGTGMGVGEGLVGKLAQKLFLERWQKQQGVNNG